MTTPAGAPRREVDSSDTRGNLYITLSSDDGTYLTLIASYGEAEHFQESKEDK